MSISEKSQAQDPHNLPDNFHRQFMYYSSVGICALIFIVTVLRQFIFSFPFYLLAPSYVISFIFSVVAWRERVKGSFSWHAKLYFLGIFLLIINGGISNGGLRAPIVAGIVLLPIIAGALFDLKKSWLGFVSSALCLSIILFLEKQGWVTSYKDKDTMPIFMMTLSVSALATVIGHTYNKVRHENRRSLYKLHEELTHLAKVSAIADMANALAHEINNPLAIISGRA